MHAAELQGQGRSRVTTMGLLDARVAALTRMLVAKGRPSTTEVEGRSLRRIGHGHVSTKEDEQYTGGHGLKTILTAGPTSSRGS